MMSHEAHRQLREIQRVDIDHRHAELRRQRRRHRAPRCEAVLHQPRGERNLLPERISAALRASVSASAPSATSRRAMPVSPAKGGVVMCDAIGGMPCKHPIQN